MWILERPSQRSQAPGGKGQAGVTQSDQSWVGAQAAVGLGEASGALGYPKEKPFLAWSGGSENFLRVSET